MAQAGAQEQSQQWQMAYAVAEMIFDAEHLDLEVMFVLCELGPVGEKLTSSLCLKTLAGSVAFLDDSRGNCWFARWNDGRTSGTAQRLKGNEDIHRIADRCFQTLSGNRSDRQKSLGLN